ncbi:MAG: hypothetical protein ACRYGP_30555 [Janthinobacterium lividum]
MSRRQLFQAADLARALKVAQEAGLTIARVEIEPSGKIVIITHHDASGDDREEGRIALEALRRRIADDRDAKVARQGPASRSDRGSRRTT